MRRAIFVAALALAGCRSAPPEESVSGPGFVLVSPFDENATAQWRDLVAQDVVDVAALFHTDVPDPPVTVVLDPIDVPESASVAEHLVANVDGLQGQTTGDGRIRIIVASEGGGLVSTANHAKLRHELSHDFLRRRCPGAPLWLHEGLAHVVDDTVSTQTGLALHPAPRRLAVARALAPTTDTAALWTWDSSSKLSRDEESAHRVLACSFVRFLLEREGPGWPDALPRLAALRPGQDPALVGAWRQWLEAVDFTALVERGTQDADPAIRAAAANALPQLAEAALSVPALRGAIGAATDAVAFRALTDPFCWQGAATYLAWFRARDLAEKDVAALTAAESPAAVRITGLAVAAQRGVRVAPDEVRALCASLPEHVRRRVIILRPFLPGID